MSIINYKRRVSYVYYHIQAYKVLYLLKISRFNSYLQAPGGWRLKDTPGRTWVNGKGGAQSLPTTTVNFVAKDASQMKKELGLHLARLLALRDRFIRLPGEALLV